MEKQKNKKQELNKIIKDRICIVCGKTQGEHIDNLWCYRGFNGQGSSDDWKKFTPKHSEEEIVSFGTSLNFVTNSLLKSLEKIHEDNEQFFNECSILGVDRLDILDSIKKLLGDYRDKTWKEMKEYQTQTAELTRGLEKNKQFGKVSKIVLPDGSKIYITKKGWTLVAPNGKEMLLPWGEIDLAFKESISQGYVKPKEGRS